LLDLRLYRLGYDRGLQRSIDDLRLEGEFGEFYFECVHFCDESLLLLRGDSHMLEDALEQCEDFLVVDDEGRLRVPCAWELWHLVLFLSCEL